MDFQIPCFPCARGNPIKCFGPKWKVTAQWRCRVTHVCHEVPARWDLTRYSRGVKILHAYRTVRPGGFLYTLE